ncbi:hypothetical protein BH20ACT23_BH20ACT23_12450 [soil metagenome]
MSFLSQRGPRSGSVARTGLVVSAVAALSVAATPTPAYHRVIKGGAVYYANRYVGRTMACGGTYQRYKMVAAHKSLPCGTRVRITNRRNGRTVKVRVKDRGPFGDKNLKFDVSRRAANRLGMINAGADQGCDSPQVVGKVNSQASRGIGEVRPSTPPRRRRRPSASHL